MRLQLCLVALLSLVVSACASPAAPRPPVLSYSGANCVTVPDLSGAITLEPQKDKAVWSVDQPMSGETSCLAHRGLAGPYLLYRLPAAGSARVIEIGSVLELASLFSPEVTLLDSAGRVARSFEPEMYMFRDGIYSVQFTPRDDERFALVTANPALVGQKHDTIVAGTTSTYIYTGYGGMNWRSGSEVVVSRDFSYEGLMRATVYRRDKD